MISCEEAKLYLNQCGLSRIDRERRWNAVRVVVPLTLIN